MSHQPDLARRGTVAVVIPREYAPRRSLPLPTRG